MAWPHLAQVVPLLLALLHSDLSQAVHKAYHKCFSVSAVTIGGDDILITGGLHPPVIIAYHSRFVLPAGDDLNFQNPPKTCQKIANFFLLFFGPIFGIFENSNHRRLVIRSDYDKLVSLPVTNRL